MNKIAIDLDGVVFDSENLYRVYTEIYDTDIIKKESLIDNTQRIFQKSLRVFVHQQLNIGQGFHLLFLQKERR